MSTYNTANGRSALYYNTGNYNTASGYVALYKNTTGAGNTAYGRSALLTNTRGSNITTIGFGADVVFPLDPITNLPIDTIFTNATAIGYNAKVNHSNKVRIGNAAVTVIEGQVPWTSTSDKRLKNSIADLGLGLDFI